MTTSGKAGPKDGEGLTFVPKGRLLLTERAMATPQAHLPDQLATVGPDGWVLCVDHDCVVLGEFVFDGKQL